MTIWPKNQHLWVYFGFSDSVEHKYAFVNVTSKELKDLNLASGLLIYVFVNVSSERVRVMNSYNIVVA